jgi:ketosteroid isomerase-like protein
VAIGSTLVQVWVSLARTGRAGDKSDWLRTSPREEENVVAEHPNVGLLREAISTFNRSDFDAYRKYFTEDVVWHVGGNHPLSGDYRGRDAIFEYFEKVRELTGGGLRSAPQDILADDSHGGVFTRVTADRGDRHLDVVLAQAYRINPDGKFTEYWALADDQDAVNAFWS